MDNPLQNWIGASRECSGPLFRRKFIVDSQLTKAYLLISGVGYHEAWINNQRVGNHVLDPAQTDYDCRVFYVTHDVTQLLTTGANALGVVLGNGWYNQDRVWGEHGLFYGQPRLMAELHLVYRNGVADTIRADNFWRWTAGPITENNIYAGEIYDARLEADGWTDPEFDDSEWSDVAMLAPPGGELLEQTMPPMRQIEELKPIALNSDDNGIYTVDFGQNFSGWVRIRVEGSRGTVIVLRFAEIVSSDGTIDTASTGTFATGVEQVDTYICRGSGAEVWEPRFTYHGFRYVEISGWPGILTPEDVTGVVVHNDLPIGGGFECSDERLNTLHHMALWTHRSNVHGIPEDCPARERCGWLGDANLVAEYSLWNLNSACFWEKYLDDIETTRRTNGGVPSDVAPGKRGTTRHANPDWAAAFIMLPWYVYQFSGDSAVIQRHWEGMTQLMAHFESIADCWILKDGYGDFFDPGTDAIVQHTPIPLTSTLWFYRCTDVMATMAEALGDVRYETLYREWQERIAGALRLSFYDDERGSFGSQGGNVLALAFGVLPDQTDRLLITLVADIRERSNHMNVGVMGVRYILEVLTENGYGDLALELMHQNTYPSFGHLIERGATTLWECWGEDGHDNTHGPRSLNHPFMGGYDNWFFNTLAGIGINPKTPGFVHIYLNPHPISGLDWVRCHHDCPSGRVESNWQINDGVFNWNVVIPTGVTATAVQPFSDEVHHLKAGSHSLSFVIS